MTLAIHEDVAHALESGAPVVALETAVVTHGLPHTAMPDVWPDGMGNDDDRTAPLNLGLIRAMARAVRQAGALPAPVGVLDGVLCVGLQDEDLERLAADPSASKVSSASLSTVLAAGGSAGTTVGATLVACRAAGIQVFATGGTGGVHTNWTTRPDISGDLAELARTQCCVISAGAKSILDLAATLEALESLGVPVVGLGTKHLPRFHSGPDPDLPITCEVDSVEAAAAICRTRWNGLQQPGGVLLANPIAPALELDPIELARATAEAETACAGVDGPGRTPALLESLAELTGGRSITANIGLLLGNAEVGGRLAAALTWRG